MMYLTNEYHSGFSRGSEMSLPCCVVCTECCLCTNRSFEPPKRDEERETERKLKAKRARESRRSTQVRTFLVVYDSRMWSLINPIYSLDHWIKYQPTANIDGLVQERRNSSALVMELRLSCLKALIYLEDICRRNTSCSIPYQMSVIFRTLFPAWIFVSNHLHPVWRQETWGNGLVPNRCQSISWTNDDLLLDGPCGKKNSFKRMNWKVLSAKCWQFVPAAMF